MRCFVVGLALLAALAPAAGWANDQDIAQCVMARLEHHKQAGQLKDFLVDMEVDRGCVWLKGRVASAEQHRQVLASAQSAPGVKNVIDDLVIAPPPAPAANPLKRLGGALSKNLPAPPAAVAPAQAQPVAFEQAGPRQATSQPIPTAEPAVVQTAEPMIAVERAPAQRVPVQPVPPQSAAVLEETNVIAVARPEPKLTRLPPPAEEPVTPILPAAPVVNQVEARPQVEESPIQAAPAPTRAQPAQFTPIADADPVKPIPATAPRALAEASPIEVSRALPEPTLQPIPMAPVTSPQVSSAEIQALQSQLQAMQAHMAQMHQWQALAAQAHAYQMASRGPVAFAPSTIQQTSGAAFASPHHAAQPGYGMGPAPAYLPGANTVAPARYDHPQMPAYAWPSYASHPNYAALTYPKQYSPTAWPYIGPFYPYPQVPLGWRKVSLEWDDGWWFLDFMDH